MDHHCQINHTKSSGAMESAGAVDMFSHVYLIYKEYLGDADQNVVPVKLECVGHVQKRLGTRLRNLVKAHKGTKTPYQAEEN